MARGIHCMHCRQFKPVTDRLRDRHRDHWRLIHSVQPNNYSKQSYISSYCRNFRGGDSAVQFM